LLHYNQVGAFHTDEPIIDEEINIQDLAPVTQEQSLHAKNVVRLVAIQHLGSSFFQLYYITFVVVYPSKLRITLSFAFFNLFMICAFYDALANLLF
jgi:hypothetical protein